MLNLGTEKEKAKSGAVSSGKDEIGRDNVRKKGKIRRFTRLNYNSEQQNLPQCP